MTTPRRPAWAARASGRDRRARPGLLAELAGRLLELLGRGRRPGVVPRRFERLGEEPRRGLVAALGEGDGELAWRAAVELGRSAGARTGPAGQAPVLGDQQAFPDEAVEVEGGERAGHPDRGGGRVAPTASPWATTHS